VCTRGTKARSTLSCFRRLSLRLQLLRSFRLRLRCRRTSAFRSHVSTGIWKSDKKSFDLDDDECASHFLFLNLILFFFGRSACASRFLFSHAAHTPPSPPHLRAVNSIDLGHHCFNLVFFGFDFNLILSFFDAQLFFFRGRQALSCTFPSPPPTLPPPPGPLQR
jgi:hypothetical protein